MVSQTNVGKSLFGHFKVYFISMMVIGHLLFCLYLCRTFRYGQQEWTKVDNQEEGTSGNKSVRFRNASDNVQAMNDGNNLMTSYDEKNISCANGKNCFSNDSRDKNGLQPEKSFNETVTLLKHTALRHIFVDKLIARIFNFTQIPANVERGSDFYVWTVIPEKILNERNVGETFPSKSDVSDVKLRNAADRRNTVTCIDKTEMVTCIDKTEKLEDFPESMIVINENSTVTLPTGSGNPIPVAWWDGTWFWIAQLLAVILFLIIILSCCIWHCGSSSRQRQPNYIRI